MFDLQRLYAWKLDGLMFLCGLLLGIFHERKGPGYAILMTMVLYLITSLLILRPIPKGKRADRAVIAHLFMVAGMILGMWLMRL